MRPHPILNRTLRFGTALALAAALFGFGVNTSRADTFPSKPIRIVVSFAAGSGSDIFARYLAEEFRAILGQPVIVENKPGAAGQIAATTVAKAPADGYTLLYASNSSHSVNPHLVKDLPYDPIADFTPIVGLASVPYLIVIDPKLPPQSLPEFITWARANPGKVTYAYPTSAVQVQSAEFDRLLKLDALAVAYKSSPQAMMDIVGNRISFMLIDMSASRGHIADGQLRALAVVQKKRTALAPDIPTVGELVKDLADFEFNAWTGLVGPANMPKEAVEKLSKAAMEIMQKPTYREKLAAIGFEPTPSDSETFRKILVDQLAVWGTKIKAAGIQPE